MALQLRKSLFWDTDIENIHLDNHKRKIIERTLLRGTKEEFDSVLEYNGWDTVRDVVLSARYLDKYSLSFCSVVFGIPKSEYRYFKLAQSNPGHWDF